MTGDQAAELASRLRSARTFLNLSQQFVADQTGITRSAVSEIERGARTVSSVELGQFAKLYRLSPSYLLTGQDEEAAQSDTVKALARATEQLSATEQDEVLRFALFLKNYRSPSGET
jgi:transcriptional regulator with XRE-family HTH domain